MMKHFLYGVCFAALFATAYSHASKTDYACEDNLTVALNYISDLHLIIKTLGKGE